MFIGLVGLGIFWLFSSSMDKAAQTVNLALKQDGKTYLFSNMGSYVVENSIANNESPAVMPFFQIYNDGGLYVDPLQMKEAAALIMGSYEVFEYQEKSYEGYVTLSEDDFYGYDMTIESTENIGEQFAVNTIKLKDFKDGKPLEIVWKIPNNGDVGVPVQYCEVQSLNVVEHPAAGETVISSQDFLVVDLNKLVGLCDNGSTLEYNDEQKILYVIKN